MKKAIAVVVLLASTAAFTVGCTAGDVRSGSRGVGVGIGAGDPWYPGWPGPRHPERPLPDYPPPGNIPDEPGYPDIGAPAEPPQNPNPPPRRPVRPPGAHCDKWGCWDPTQPNSVVSTWEASHLATSSVAARLAKKYSIPMNAAQRISQSFADVNAHGMNAFYAMGLTEEDMKGFMKRRLPAEASIKTAAGKLGLSEQKTRGVLTQMMREFYAQAANVKSEYWQRCMADGQWKTDRNQSCSKTFWPGCSPEKGAQFCY